MKRFWILLSISLLVSSTIHAQMPLDDELYAYVLGIEGRTNLDRGEFIKEQLHRMNVGYVTAPYKNITVTRGKKTDTTVIVGTNIIVRMGKGPKQIVVGAHYDAVPHSPGANDNGSGVAVALALIRHLQDMKWNYAVDFCFFDQKESKMMGSMYYVSQFVIPKRHLAMINLDYEGSGEEVYVGPVNRNNRFLMRFVRDAALKTGFPLVEMSEYPASDYQSFDDYRLENISISIVPNGDGERLSKYVRNGYKADSLDAPKVLGILHTVNDRSNLVSPASLKMSYEFTKTLLGLLNEARPAPDLQIKK
jgi:Zn-dependent M28 family amino/carboxypeptidase